MDSGTHNFASLLHPISLDEFFADYWERKPLVVQRRADDYYRGLLTDGDLEDIISNSDLRYPAIRLAKDGSYYPPAVYTNDVEIGQLLFQGVPDLAKVSAEYAKGATIALPALHRTWGPLRTLCERLQEQLDFAIDANVYVTPGQAAGFTPHYDTHDILVLQIGGRKRWLIDEPTIKLPHNSQMFNPAGFKPGPRLAEIELAGGDLLYLPRGYVHSTTTSDCHSAHVTIGINAYTWADLVGELVPSSIECEEFRKAVPPGFATQVELRPAIKQQLTRLLPGLRTDSDYERYFEQLSREAKAAARRRMRVPFRANVIALSPESRLQAPDPQRYGLARSGEDVILDFEGRKYVFPAPLWPTLSAMCASPSFCIRDLCDGLDTNAVLGFAGFLQGMGFLEKAPARSQR
jgi:ribosomal protein L16 Arg81 hydroxylase